MPKRYSNETIVTLFSLNIYIMKRITIYGFTDLEIDYSKYRKDAFTVKNAKNAIHAWEQIMRFCRRKFRQGQDIVLMFPEFFLHTDQQEDLIGYVLGNLAENCSLTIYTHSPFLISNGYASEFYVKQITNELAKVNTNE